MTIENLRKKYPVFVYESYSFKKTGKDLEISFVFKTGDIEFNPKVLIKNIKTKKDISSIVFNLGIIELFSYWKAVCSPLILIKCGYLDSFQKKWWKELLLKGMGQFFYENKIDFTKKDFVNFESQGKIVKNKFIEIKGDSVMVLIGGGKDSAVSLELAKKTKKKTSCFVLNPTKRIKKLVGRNELIIAERKIDKKLLKINKKGYLNGHTPFVAYLSFLSIIVSVLFNKKYIVLGNEESSNEGNVKYLGKNINHQYSKSFEFENNFRDYSNKYLCKNIEYFSILRPLYELQISQIFSKMPQYFKTFLSCNESQKTYSGTRKKSDKWCENCSKCLFIFVSLYPFLEEGELLKIFKTNLLNKKELIPLMMELLGEKNIKPFECVGTHKETLVAFYLSLKKNKKLKLLKYFEKKVLIKHPNIDKYVKDIIGHWGKNNLPKGFDVGMIDL
jgi:7-cyano-7-deazaguanine synthase in queuosine biosynthesis